jgi:hypothetical protein
MAKPVKRKVSGGGRVTPKKDEGRAAPVTAPGGYTSGRYTPPIPREVKVSPRWVPVLMFIFLGIGVIAILLNYVELIPAIGPIDESPNNIWLLVGLSAILLGIIVATQYH